MTTHTTPPDATGSGPGRMSLGAWIIVIVLIALLGGTAVLAYSGWTLGGPDIPASGYIALALGAIFSIVIGAGLMALLFYSSRKGYDRPAELVRDEENGGGDGREKKRD